jgi:RNA recognition motif-containing protein
MNIYVGNLSFEATEQDVRQEFSKFGEVADVKMVMDRETGKPRGFCFVEMPNDEQARQAIQAMNLQRIAGRAVTVNEARPRPERSDRRGSRGPRRY